ncbi:MAG: aldo/keto reductase [Verrucomicrobia bacterium]|nr:aldo/keto reductase [Verrucomicrobiota bacterium]
MKKVKLASGKVLPVLGLGTWRIAENRERRDAEIAALRLALDLGMSLIDTAEMYGDGSAEELVGEAISGRRDQVFVVSKVYPHNASRERLQRACERSLGRLGTDYLDLYLLHWRGSVPLAETVETFIALKHSGKILDYGVSNFGMDDMKELLNIDGSEQVAVNQVLYNLSRRGIELDLLPWCREHGIPIMAYSPIEQGRLLHKLRPLAARLGVKDAQLALAWLLRQDDIIAIPKASSEAHVRDIRESVDLNLGSETVLELDRLFPRPNRKIPLEIL